MRREMETDRCCGTCRWHKKQGGEWLCTCGDAEEYAMETGYSYGQECPEWEERNNGY